MHGISIIIPIYNVENYLEQTLASVLNQTLKDFEVVLVDDGSTDDSGAIAKKFADSDSRFKYIHKKNSGVSATRNTGIENATGKYLFFLDADDIIPSNAMELLYDAAESNDAEIVTGRLLHLKRDKYTIVRMSEIVFSDFNYLTTLADSPKLVYDTITCGKLIRRDYWDRLDLSFPSDLYYCEDMPLAFKLYNEAARVVMLDEYIYYWRVRDAGAQSATQRKNLEMIEQRLCSLRKINNYIEVASVKDFINHEKKIKSLMMDFNILVNKIVDMNSDTMLQSMELIGEYMREDDLPKCFSEIPVVYEKKYEAVIKKDCDKLRRLRTFQMDTSSSVRTLRLGNKVLGIYPGELVKGSISDMKSTIDRELLRQKAKEIVVKDDALFIKGCAYIRYLPIRTPNNVKMKAFIKNERRERVKEVELQQITTKTPFGIEKKSNSNRVAYAGTGYLITVKKEDVKDLPTGTYKLFIEWESCNQKRETTVFPVGDDERKSIDKILLKDIPGSSMGINARKEFIITIG